MKLAGLKVAIFESRHAHTLSGLVKLQGGIPLAAPSMKEVPLGENKEVFDFAGPFFKNEVQLLLLLTGVGTRALISVLETRFPKEKIIEALKKTPIVPRGPKPIRVLNELGVPFAVAVPEPNTWREVLDTLDKHSGLLPLKDRLVAVQEYGIPNRELLEGLKRRGAEVLRVPVYRWALPDNVEPMKHVIREIAGGRVDVAIFTTAVQIEHLFQVAEKLRLADPFKDGFKKMAVASVGPDTSEALRSRGIAVDIEPESPKMASLVTAAAERAEAVLTQKRGGESCAAEVFRGVLEVTTAREPENSAFLKACRLEKTTFTPVWLMRQAGRYMKDYRLLRDRVSFLELCKNKDLVTEVTVHAQEKINADAAIIFSDILLLVEAFGLGLTFTKGDGPSIQRVVRSEADVGKIPDIDPLESLGYVLEAVSQTRKALKPHIPLIGFAAAPFTLASYMVEGGASKDFSLTKKFMASGPAWPALMKKIVKATARYLNGQIGAGAQAVQIFDSWVGALSPGEYEKYALPYSRELIAEIRAGAPVIHFGTGTGPFLKKFSEAGAGVVSVDSRVRLDEAWEKIGADRAIQGNLDPTVLLKPVSEIKNEVKKILGYAAGRPGHIFNLGHGVLPETPLENVIALVDMVHELSRK